MMEQSDDLPPKIRLRHLLNAYAPSLSESYLARRMRGEPTRKESDNLKRRGLGPLEERYWIRSIEPDAITNRLRLPDEGGYGPNIVIDRSFAESAAHVIAAETLAGLKPSPDEIASRAQAITHYITFGRPAPIGIFTGQTFEGDEVTAEYGLKKPSDGEARAFLRGAAPSWSCALHVAIARRQEDEIVAALVEERCRLVLLTSAAGDGKTTMLMRLALDIRHQGWNVLFVSAPDRGVAFPPIPRSSTPVCILVDEADLAGNYSSLEAALLRDEMLHVVLAARDVEWRHAAHDFATIRSKKVFIGAIDEREAMPLAQRIIEYGAAFAPTDAEALKRRLLASSHSKYPHLLAAMINATHGAGFENTVRHMLENLERIGKDWLLRLVACGTYTYEEITEHATGRLSFRMIERIVGRRRGSDDSDAVHDLLLGMKSEIIRVGSTSATSLFDLRHPDIARIALSHWYGLDRDAPEVGRERLIEDLCEIVGALVSVIVDRPRDARYEKAYLTKVPECWLSVALDPERAEAASVGRAVFEYAIEQLGTSEEERARKVSLLLRWASIEEVLREAQSEPPADEYAPDALFARAVAIEPKAVGVWSDWAAYAVRQQRFGLLTTKDGPEINSARWIFRRAWEQGMLEDPNFAIQWASSEAAAGNPGFDFQQFGARWIFREGWTQCIKNKSELAVRWAAFEAATTQGDADARTEYSAPYIYRTAWEEGHVSANLAVAWARFEAIPGRIVDDRPAEKDAAKNAALAIFQRASDYTACRKSTLVHAWAEFDPGNARAIYRAGWEDWGVHDPRLAICWANFELQHAEGVASPDDREQAAKAILREAWKLKNCRTPIVAIYLGQLEMKNNAGDPVAPAPGTARFIFRMTLNDALRSGHTHFALSWAREEVLAGNVGSIDVEYSARWITRQFIVAHPNLASVWSCSAMVEALIGNIGESHAPAEGTARALFHHAWSLPDFAEWMACEWARLELRQVSAEKGANDSWSATRIFEESRARFEIAQPSAEEWVRQTSIKQSAILSDEEAEAGVDQLAY